MGSSPGRHTSDSKKINTSGHPARRLELCACVCGGWGGGGQCNDWFHSVELLKKKKKTEEFFRVVWGGMLPRKILKFETKICAI